MGEFEKAANITLRLAWHSDGWNGHVCTDPRANTYCSGRHSDPGGSIAKKKDVTWESSPDVAGKSCAQVGKPVPCAISCNAFGLEGIAAIQEPPAWFKSGSKEMRLDLPPATACTWPYEIMYSDDVKIKDPGSHQIWDNKKRLEKAKDYFNDLKPSKSIIVYYANYSNPFSGEDRQRYIVVGISRLKSKGGIKFFNNAPENKAGQYDNDVYVWQMPITSKYPDEGFFIPYNKYADRPDVLDRLKFEPDNPRCFKYATREISDDDLINVVERFISIVDTLIEVKDDTRNWQKSKEWLITLLVELWNTRGAYPGFPQVLKYLGCSDPLTKEYLDACSRGDSVKSYKDISARLRTDSKIARKIELLGDAKAKLLTEKLPRFNLTFEQIKSIIEKDGRDNSITSTAKEILDNPYILCEQYVGRMHDDRDDVISFYQIDNGMLPYPKYGIEPLADADSAQRFRALCVVALKWEDTQSFISSKRLLELVNHRTAQMRDWRTVAFHEEYFKAKVDKDFLSKAIFIKDSENGELFLYLKEIHEDEYIIEKEIKKLVDRPDIKLTRPANKQVFEKELRELSKNNGRLESMDEYKSAIQDQADKCVQVFNKGFCIISGSAGTGKTTLIQAIISQIVKTDGQGAGNIALLAPTGKATERIREKIEESDNGAIAQPITIHSLLTEYGWLNENLTFKRTDGRPVTGKSTIIIDESSMIHLELFAALVRAIKWSEVKRLILVGDPNQLPPIGRGKVFSDIIEWIKAEHKAIHPNCQSPPECLAVLTENIRQISNKANDAGNGILELAGILIQEKLQFDDNKPKSEPEWVDQNNQACDSVEDGNFFKYKLEDVLLKIQTGGKVENDLFVEYWKTPKDLELLIEQQLLTDLKAEDPADLSSKWIEACKIGSDSFNPSFLQVISPFRGEEFGTEYLNTILQKMLNPIWSSRTTLDGITYYDKVIQSINHTRSKPIYAHNSDDGQYLAIEVFNGAMGFVYNHHLDESWKTSGVHRFDVKFKGKKNYSVGYGSVLPNPPKEPKKSFKPIDNLELAYAISVHKSQGSEFDIVYAVIPKKKSSLLSMELLYTAVTRAKKKLVLFIQEDVSSLSRLTKRNSSAVQRINSSVFQFKPLPQELLYLPDWYEEYKVISTLSEYFVRSKSEALIANELHHADLNFFYEKPLYATDGTMYLPDFTIIYQGEEYYWEHLGLLNSEKYQASWAAKETWYKKHFPDKLITTKEGNDLSEQIKQKMLEWFSIKL